jgi:hypothetical protein
MKLYSVVHKGRVCVADASRLVLCESTRSRGRCHTPKEDIPRSLVQLSEFRTQLNKEIFEYSM